MTTNRPQFPWYDDKSSQLKRAARLLERWRHCKTSQTREDYTRLSNVYARHLCYNKRKIISERVLECEKHSKKLYILVNNLIGRVQTNPMPKKIQHPVFPIGLLISFFPKL